LPLKLFHTLFSIYINNLAGPPNPEETSEDERERMVNEYFDDEGQDEQDAASHTSHHSNRSQGSEFSPVPRSLARGPINSSRIRKRAREDHQEPVVMNLLAKTAVSTGACHNIYINKKKPSKRAHPTKQAAGRRPRKKSLL
jgi:hypothetical protein